MKIEADRLRELVEEAQGGRVSDELVSAWTYVAALVWHRRWRRMGMDRDDAVQEALLALLLALPEMRPDGSLFAFSWTCAYWAMLGYWRRERRHLPLPDEDSGGQAG